MQFMQSQAINKRSFMSCKQTPNA